MSVDDLAQLVYLNTSHQDHPLKFLLDDTSYIEEVFDVNQSVTESERSEFNNTVIPLSRSAPIAEAARASLSRTTEQSVQDYRSTESALYNVSLTNNQVLVIALRGDFLTAIADKEVLLDFMRECLRCYYGSVPAMYMVGGTSLYHSYLQELKTVGKID